MRRAARTDANQTEIVAALRHLGCSVLPLHAVGQGCPDLLVAYGLKNHLLELKDGSKPPSKRKLTPAQVEFHANWKGPIFTVTSVSEALKCMGIFPVERGWRDDEVTE